MKGRGVNKPPVSVQEEEKKSSSSLGIGHKLDSKTAMTAGTMTSSAGTSHHTRSHSRLAQSAQRSQEKAPLWTKTSISMEQSQAPPPISTYDIVCLVCRPWRKPEGALNRPVLLMMLRAIMMYVMSCPGCTQPDIAIKFNPILQPQAVLELIEMLEDLGAITRTVIQVEHRSSLFSRRTLYANTSDDVCREGNVVSFEANIDCVMRVGQFCSTLE